MITFKERPTGIVQVNETVVDISTPGSDPESTLAASTLETTQPTIEAPPPPTPQSFRTDDDRKRTKRAAEVVAKAQAAVDAAQSAVNAADDTCVAEPTEKAFAKARDARRQLDETTRDLDLARSHAAKVEGEIVAAEHAAIRAEIARRESCLTQTVDDEARLLAVEIAAIAVKLQRHTMRRADDRRAEIEALNTLRARVGQPQQEVPWDHALVGAAVTELGELGLSAQVQLGVRSDGRINKMIPFWQTCGVLNEFVAGHNYEWSSGDGRQDHADRVIADAAKLLERVDARRGGDISRTIASVAKAAAVGTLGVIAALTMAWG
jgi:hypothetical protein